MSGELEKHFCDFDRATARSKGNGALADAMIDSKVLGPPIREPSFATATIHEGSNMASPVVNLI